MTHYCNNRLIARKKKYYNTTQNYAIIDMSANAMTSTECAICLVSFRDGNTNVHTTECGHSFHHRCFHKIKTSYCPCCRAPVLRDYKVRLAESNDAYKNAKRNYDTVLVVITKKIDAAEKEIDKIDKLIIQVNKEHKLAYKVYADGYFINDDHVYSISERLAELNSSRIAEIGKLSNYGGNASRGLKRYSESMRHAWDALVQVRITRFDV